MRTLVALDSATRLSLAPPVSSSCIRRRRAASRRWSRSTSSPSGSIRRRRCRRGPSRRPIGRKGALRLPPRCLPTGSFCSVGAGRAVRFCGRGRRTAEGVWCGTLVSSHARGSGRSVFDDARTRERRESRSSWNGRRYGEGCPRAPAAGRRLDARVVGRPRRRAREERRAGQVHSCRISRPRRTRWLPRRVTTRRRRRRSRSRAARSARSSSRSKRRRR